MRPTRERDVVRPRPAHAWLDQRLLRTERCSKQSIRRKAQGAKAQRRKAQGAKAQGRKGARGGGVLRPIRSLRPLRNHHLRTSRLRDPAGEDMRRSLMAMRTNDSSNV